MTAEDRGQLTIVIPPRHRPTVSKGKDKSTMSSPPPSSKKARSRRRKQQQSTTANDVECIVIDSDSDDDDRKPAAKTKPSSAAKSNPLCISLLDSDEENDVNHGGGRGIISMTSPSSRKQRADLHDRESCMLGLGSMSSAKKKRKSSCLMSTMVMSKTEAADRELAEKLQRQENLAANKASARREKKAMANSSYGKATLAVQEIVALVNNAKEKFLNNNPALKKFSVETVTIDDMVFFAKNMLELQQDYVQKQICGHIDLGYHYTNSAYIANIRTHGLLTSADRSTNNVKAAPRGR